MADQGSTVKIWKLSTDSTSQYAVGEDFATMVGDKKNFIKTSSGGNVIYGPTSIVAGAESIRTGGVFVELPDPVQGIPSTEVTPLPGKIPLPPLHVAFDLAVDVAYFAMLLLPTEDVA